MKQLTAQLKTYRWARLSLFIHGHSHVLGHVTGGGGVPVIHTLSHVSG